MNINNDQSVQLSHKNGPLASSQNGTKRQAQQNLVEAIGNSRDILVRATTVFPLTLFPDTLTIDRTKITITHRDFFKVAEVMSIGIEDVLNVTATVGPFFWRRYNLDQIR